MIKLAAPNLGDKELEAIKKVFDSNILVQGDDVFEFEKRIEDIIKVKYAMAVSSGTAALHLALMALGIKSGDEVIVPALSFPATWNTVEVMGAHCIFVDIEKDTFNMDMDKIEALITEKTKAVIVVHEFGSVANMGKLLRLKEKYRFKIIEDAACALGAKYKDEFVGTIGDIGCFSFHPRKNVTTGEGGVVATNSETIASKIKLLRNHGMQYENGKIDFEIPGLNYRMTNIQAAIGNIQLNSVKENYGKRRAISEIYLKELKDIDKAILPKTKEYEQPIWQSFCIILESKYDRDKLKEYLLKCGVESNYGAYSVNEIAYYSRKYKFTPNMYKKSSEVFNNGLCLPIHNNMLQSDAEFVVKSVLEFYYKNNL